MKFFIPIVIAALVSILISLSYFLGLFSGLENFFEDLLFSPKPVHPDIVIVAIDSESINKIGQWPWPREVFAKALLALDKNPPKVIGLDVIFSEESRLGAKDDVTLAQALKNISYSVILPAEAQPLLLNKDRTASAGGFLKTLPVFLDNKNASLGCVNLILDKDGVARRVILSITKDEEICPSFSRAVAQKAQNQSIDVRRQYIENTQRIVYAAPPGSIKRIPFGRVLEGDAGEELRNKIIFIGATASDLHDEQLTPFSRGAAMSGVEIQANIANMFLSGYRLNDLSKTISIFWIFLAAILPAVFFIIMSRSLKPLLVNIGFGILYVIVIIILFENGVVANFIHINFAWMLSTASLFAYRYWFGEKERRELRESFSKYVSKEVLDHILEEPGRMSLGGEEKEITILFSDIRGFTTLSEKTTPQELVHVLNRYFTAMTKIIFEHQGVVDKFIGDAIMAFWGAPLEDKNQAENAVRAGLGMVAALKKFNEELKAEGKPEIDIGVGIYTGPAVVGNVGSEMRFDYTAIGDSVNVASRLEGLNKAYNTHIVIGESTQNKLEGNYDLKPLGSVEVKGRKQPLNIYGK